MPEYRPVEKGIVIRAVVNPKPISKFPDDTKRDMHLRYTVSQMMREGYDEMELVEFHTVIKYELVSEEGFDNLYDAYVDWWKSNVPQREEVSLFKGDSSMGFIITNVYDPMDPVLISSRVRDELTSQRADAVHYTTNISFQNCFGVMTVDYTLVKGAGRPNLWQAYRDWWDAQDFCNRFPHVAGGFVKMPSAWTSKSFYPINPIKEKENKMQFTISKNQIKRQINALEDLRQDQIKEIQKDLETKLERLEKGETIGALVIGIRNLSEISEQLEYLYSLELADSISCSESEKAQIFKTFEIAKAVESAE